MIVFKKIVSVLKNRLLNRKRIKQKYNQNDWINEFNYEGVIKPTIDEATEVNVKQNTRTKICYLITPTPRTGHNFLRRLLECHPNIAFPQGRNLTAEHYILDYSNQFFDYINKTVGHWSNWIKEGEIHVNRHKYNLAHYFGYSIHSYFQCFIPDSAKILLLKTPSVNNIHNFFHLFPEGYLLVMIRDGRDTVESYSKTWGQDQFISACFKWRKGIDKIFDLKERLVGSRYENQLIFVSYEDLLFNQKRSLNVVIQNLGLDFNKYVWEMQKDIKIMGSSTLIEEKGIAGWKGHQKTKGFRPTEKWKSWGVEKRFIFKLIAGRALIRAGYVEDNKW